MVLVRGSSPREDTSGQVPRPAGWKHCCGLWLCRAGLSHMWLLILQLPEEAAWLSPSPERKGGEETEFLRKGPWFTADTEGLKSLLLKTLLRYADQI